MTVRAVRRLLALLACLGYAFAQGEFHLKDGDRVVFYGDSITDQRLYTTFAETYVLTRFPHLRTTFVHSGWGGDRVSGGAGGPIDVRLERDVLPYKPTIMTIMLGMNDGRYRAFDPEIFNTFAAGYTHILEKVRKALPGIRITVIRPSPYDDVTRPPTFPGGYNAVLVRYGQFLGELADGDSSLTVADLNAPVAAALEKAKAADPKLAMEIVRDRVHPGPGGHLLMAAALLKAWNAPALVTAVEIDGAVGKAVEARNTDLSGLTTQGRVSWTQLDRALPMPYDSKDAALMLAVASSHFVQALNQQLLKVTGLTAAKYSLRINDEEIGSFSKEQLADGINLAVLATPMAKQAAEVHTLTLKHNHIHFARWRQVQVPLQNDNPAHLKQALDALDLLESDLVAQQRAGAQPKPSRYDLVPVD